jgi:hypothetical protein
VAQKTEMTPEQLRYQRRYLRIEIECVNWFLHKETLEASRRGAEERLFDLEKELRRVEFEMARLGVKA